MSMTSTNRPHAKTLHDAEPYWIIRADDGAPLLAWEPPETTVQRAHDSAVGYGNKLHPLGAKHSEEFREAVARNIALLAETFGLLVPQEETR